MLKLNRKFFALFMTFVLVWNEEILLGRCATISGKNDDDRKEHNKTLSFKHFDPIKAQSSFLEQMCLYGEPLEYGACMVQNYRKHILPLRNLTIFTKVNNLHIYDVSAKLGTYSMRVELQMYWRDPGIKLDEDQDHSPLSIKSIAKIWTPAIFISNLSNYRTFFDSQYVSSITLWPSNKLKLFKDNQDTVVELIISFEASVSCWFNFSHYPKDESHCDFIFGSQNNNIRYAFMQEVTPTYQSTTGLHECTMTLSNRTLLDGLAYKNDIAISIRIQRTMRPFIYRYYLPSVGGFVISTLSVLLPPGFMQARVTLSVTCMLMTVNLYVMQMVSFAALNVT